MTLPSSSGNIPVSAVIEYKQHDLFTLYDLVESIEVDISDFITIQVFKIQSGVLLD